ncbi:hypothetical protein QQX98_001277 [Neonectria punicea]|uniref:TauD/TfdA-like domain-containing protein n=1 Tax=Neonectria punicea TaxID=979145 RepID=A0ABR1HQA3_9HYPO
MATAAALHPPSDGFKATLTPISRFAQEQGRNDDPSAVLLEEAERLKREPPLVDEELLEIDNALKHFHGLGLWGGEINGGNFPLPTLSKKLVMLKQDVLSGRGFVNIRGLEADRYSPEDTSLVFVGICKSMGTRIGRQDEGYALGHIREANRSETSQDHRPFRDSNLALTYHTDGYCPILGMQMRAEAAEGGDHLLASSWAIYNELATTRPDIIRLLATPNWYFDPRGIHDDPRPRSIIFYEGETQQGAGDGKLIINFIRYLLTGRPGVPKLAASPDCTSQQIEALDAIEAFSRKHSLKLDVRPGDIAFVNNWSMLHSRTAFRDDEEHVRYLVRIWLKNDNPVLEWPMPAVFRMGHLKIFDEDDHTLKWNVTPQPRLAFKIYQMLAQA